MRNKDFDYTITYREEDGHFDCDILHNGEVVAYLGSFDTETSAEDAAQEYLVEN